MLIQALRFRFMAGNALTCDEARALLADYAACRDSRNDRIRAAVAAGLEIDEIASILGMGRASIYRALPRRRASPRPKAPAQGGADLERASWPGASAGMPLFLAPPDLRKHSEDIFSRE